MTYRQKESGQALIIVVLGIVVLIGALGLGIDMGYYRYQKRQLQTAADAAALAGAQALPTVANVPTAANQALTNNGYGSSSGTTISINTPPTCTTGTPCNLPVADPNHGKINYVEVVLTQNQPTFFSKIFGVTSVPVTARAEAESNLNCIYTLGTTNTDITIGAAVVNTDCGIVDESSSNDALTCVLGLLSSPSTEIVGKAQSFLCFNTAKPRTGITLPTTPYDPLKYLQNNEPTALPCGTTTATPFHGAPATGGALIFGTGHITGHNVLYADGTYCTGISLYPGANVTFNTANGSTFQLKGTPGGLTVGSGIGISFTGSSVDGSAGVTFYNIQGAIQFLFPQTGQGTVVLAAPSSGPLTGVLFFQPPSNNSAAQVLGTWSGSTHLTGGYYLPAASLTYVFDFGTNSFGDYAPLVVNTLNFYLSASWEKASIFNQPPSGLSPLRSQNAVLVE